MAEWDTASTPLFNSDSSSFILIENLRRGDATLQVNLNLLSGSFQDPTVVEKIRLIDFRKYIAAGSIKLWPNM